jgi:hypothetical protein
MNETTRASLISSTKVDRKKLRTWFATYLAAWLSALILLMSQNSITDITVALWGGTLVLYIVCLVFSYNVQMSLYSLGLTKGSGAAVVIGGLILNPFFLGFVIPLWILIDSKKIEKTVAANGTEDVRR